MKTIPVSSAPHQVFSVTLEGRKIEVRLRYRVALDAWFIDLSDGGVALITGQRLSTGVDILAPHALELGSLLCFANDQPGVDPGRNDLGGRVSLIHASEAEKSAAISA